jgi:V/A-type H+-transporting ATPase subunit E
MSLDRLKEEILGDAELQVKEILSKAEEEANKILEEARNKAELEKARRKEAVKKRLLEKESAAVSLANIEGKKLLLDVKESIINDLYDKIKERLLNISRDDAYMNSLIKLAVEAIKAVGTSSINIQLNHKDKEFVEKNWNKFYKSIAKEVGNVEIHVVNDPLNILGGVVVSSRDGTIIYNNSLDSRLERIFKDERNELINILFGE